jgi:regulator of protease activity HflC (stomatin/prohibitin superfamily)
MLVVLVLMFVIAAWAPRIFVTVPSGDAGVLWLRFFGGTVTKGPALGEGLHIIFPWDRIFIYDMRTRAEQRSYEVISKDGLHFQLSVTLRWHLLAKTLPHLQQEYGPNYVDVLLLPEVGSVARDVIAQYNTEEVYSYRRSHIQQQIYDEVVAEERTNAIGPAEIKPDDVVDYVSLIDVLITNMTLPTSIQKAIARKVEQLLISEEYVYRLQTERQEAERKAIEARGIEAFQQTVQKGITDSYLKWRGIEATLKLATSPNAKVVVIGGGGSQGLPLILNTGDTPTPPAAASTPPASAAQSPAATTEPKVGADGVPPPSNGPRRMTAPTQSTDAAQEPPALLQELAKRLGYRLQPLPPSASEPAPPVAKPK